MSSIPPELSDQVYAELYSLAEQEMRGERRNHTLQPTALVNEAYLRLARYGDTVWASRGRFRAIAASCIRRILIEHARARGACKRGRDHQRVTLVDMMDESSSATEVNVLELEEVLQELEERDAKMARLIELRYFGGLTVQESADELDMPLGTVKDHSRFALAWLRMRLDSPSEA